MRGLIAAAVLAGLSTSAAAQQVPQDADTLAWWQTINHLASDAHEGRDTGSAGHARAVGWVADAFAKAGLKPAGDDGRFTQTVPLHEVRIEKTGTIFKVVTPGAETTAETTLNFLHDIGIRADASLPDTLGGALAFRGYCGKNDVGSDVAGKIVLCFGARRAGLPGGAERQAAVEAAGAAALITIDDIGYTLEPPRWPEAYARRITIRTSQEPAEAPAETAPSLPSMRLNVDALPALLAGSTLSAASLLETAIAGAPLASLDLPTRMEITLARSERSFTSDNVLALLPGTDPALATEMLVVSAHIDGYGFGEPVDGDSLYNGAFDDAAYVAALLRLAQNRAGKGYRRPVLFAVFTGEEKGLLGARWFVEHKRPATPIIADINLDAIRPLFPLKALTLIGLEQSSLVDHVRAAAAPMGIEIRPDLEPIRGMIGRTDAAPFLRAGIPAVSFMFAYDDGSPEEARFRQWYRTRYHRPQDDVTQPIDFIAARDFNRFFYALTARLADTDQPPVMTR